METFGDEREPASERQIKMIVPARAVNSTEIELRGMLAEAIAATPTVPFVDGDTGEFENAADHGNLSLRTTLDVQNLVHGDIAEKFRRQITIARELGPKATMALYQTACLLEGVEPLITEKIR